MREQLSHYRLPLAIAVAIVACLYAFNPNFRYATGPSASPYGGDFLQEWLGGWIVRAGDHARFYDVDYAYDLQHDPSLVGFAWNADEYLPVVYPPFYYLIVSPMSLVPLHASAWIWAGLMVVALGASLHLMLRLCSSDCQSEQMTGGLAIRPTVWLIPAAMLFYPVLESLSSSQKGTLCLLIFTATYCAWSKGRAFTAGMIFGLITFKPQLALVIAAAAIWKRQWRFVGGLATTCAVLLGLSLCLGLDVCWQYVRFALSSGDYMQTGGYDLHKSHSVWGFAALLMPQASNGMRLCFSVLMAGLVVHPLTRLLRDTSSSGSGLQPEELHGAKPDGIPIRPTSGRFAMQFSGLVIATILLSPHLFTYDLAILLLPMGLTLLRAAVSDSSRANTTALWLLGLMFISPAISTSIATETGLQVTVILMLWWLNRIADAAFRPFGTEDTERTGSTSYAALTPVFSQQEREKLT